MGLIAATEDGKTFSAPLGCESQLGQLIDFQKLLGDSLQSVKSTAIANVTNQMLSNPTVQAAMAEKAKTGIAATVADELVEGFDKTTAFMEKHKKPLMYGAIAAIGLAALGGAMILKKAF